MTLPIPLTVLAQASAPVVRSDLQAVVNLLAIGTMLLYLVLAGVRMATSARRRPLDALLVLALAVAALAVRWLSAPRTVVLTAHSDLSHLVDIAAWARDGLSVHVGLNYPPAWRGLLHLVSMAFGPSLDAAFAMTTIAGALGVVPVFLLARRLSGSRVAATLAALAFAAYPTAVYFANGFNLETPASVLLVAGFVHLLAWLDGRRHLDAALYALSMLAFVQTRMEGLGVAPVLVAMHVAIAARTAGWRRLRPILAWSGAAMALALPFLVQAVLLMRQVPVQASKATGMLVPVEIFLLLVLAVAWDSKRYAEPAARFAGEASLRTVFAGAAGLLFLAVALLSWPGNPLWPGNVTTPELPGFEMHVTWPYGMLPDDRFYPTWLVMPGVFPLAFLVAWFAGLLPARDDRPLAFPPAAAMLLLLPWFGFHLTRMVGTGIAPLEGMRHHVLFTGVVATSVGLGAFRIAEWFAQRVRVPAVAWACAGLVLASPVLTHRSMIADNDFDTQREFAFARKAVDALPPRALVLVPDDDLDLGAAARVVGGTVLDVFRTGHLFTALGWLHGADWQVEGFRSFLASGRVPDRPIVFYQGLECYRALHPDTLLPSCRQVRRVAGAVPLAMTRFPNRPYTGMEALRIGIAVPEVLLALLPLDAADLDEFRVANRPPDR
mgnify:CR=1 FL=1